MEDISQLISELTQQALCEDPECADELYERLQGMYKQQLQDYMQNKLNDNNSTYDKDDMLLLMHLANDDSEIDETDDDSIINSYATNLHNYLYRYKPEAVGVDSRIDPDEDQIGVMAQDLEKVNPACVKETAEGVKTVDTGKLALMNAGAIADIARRLLDIEGVLKNGR